MAHLLELGREADRVARERNVVVGYNMMLFYNAA